jgi:hypothetical protein
MRRLLILLPLLVHILLLLPLFLRLLLPLLILSLKLTVFKLETKSLSISSIPQIFSGDSSAKPLKTVPTRDIRNSVHEKVREFREIPRNFTELYVTEFGGIPPEF